MTGSCIWQWDLACLALKRSNPQPQLPFIRPVGERIPKLPGTSSDSARLVVFSWDDYPYIVRADVGTYIVTGEDEMKADFSFEDEVGRRLVTPPEEYVEVAFGHWSGRRLLPSNQ